MFEILVSTVCLFVLILLLALYFSAAQKRSQNRGQPIYGAEKAEKEFETLILLEDCYIEAGKSFNLFSKDGGKNWRVIELAEKPKILGPVEKIHPAILQNETAWQSLKEYVKENGSIRLSDRKGAKLLRKAGFDVRARD